MTVSACSRVSLGLIQGCVCVCMRACAPAGPEFVCFPPNWLVFPCPAHQTACFSSHLASLPGLEPPARMRPARQPREEEGQAAHMPGHARPDQAGQGDRPSSSPSQLPPTLLLLPGIQGLCLSQSYLMTSLKDPQCLNSQLSPSASHPSFLPRHLQPQAALHFPAKHS